MHNQVLWVYDLWNYNCLFDEPLRIISIQFSKFIWPKAIDSNFLANIRNQQSMIPTTTDLHDFYLLIKSK